MRLSKPGPGEIDALLHSSNIGLTYSEIGATRSWGRDRPPSLAKRYDFDHHSFELGSGHELFKKATTALREWKHFEIPWLSFHGTREPVHHGCTVASLVSVLGFWFVNPCRVVYAEFDSTEANGFAYGTLDGHAESGEERFRVCFAQASGQVRYEITAFSRPSLGVVRLAYPLARRIQKRFAEASARALSDAIV